MNIKPLDDRVLVEQVEEEEKVGSIIIPESAKEKPRMAKVIAVGTDEDLQEVIKVGDSVLYAKYSGTEVELENKKYIIISRSDILAIIE